MRKIETLFIRDAKGRATREVNPGCEWVLAGEGVPTRKWDGTCCIVLGGKLFKRMDWKADKGPAPDVWIHHSRDPAQRSGHGWYPVGDGPEDWMHRKAWGQQGADLSDVDNVTFELLGPCIGKNPEGMEPDEFLLRPHGGAIQDCERTYDGIRAFLEANPMEGIVWWRENGDLVKIKRRDFGLQWPVREAAKPQEKR